MNASTADEARRTTVTTAVATASIHVAMRVSILML
jgi:hypothetical protein